MIVFIEYPNCFRARPLKVRTYSLTKDVIKRLCILLKEETDNDIYDNKNLWSLYSHTGVQLRPNSTIGSYDIKANATLKLKMSETSCSTILRHTEITPALTFPIFDNRRA